MCLSFSLSLSLSLSVRLSVCLFLCEGLNGFFKYLHALHRVSGRKGENRITSKAGMRLEQGLDARDLIMMFSSFHIAKCLR